MTNKKKCPECRCQLPAHKPDCLYEWRARREREKAATIHLENMTDEPVRYLVLGPPLDSDEEEELENETYDIVREEVE